MDLFFLAVANLHSSIEDIQLATDRRFENYLSQALMMAKVVESEATVLIVVSSSPTMR